MLTPVKRKCEEMEVKRVIFVEDLFQCKWCINLNFKLIWFCCHDLGYYGSMSSDSRYICCIFNKSYEQFVPGLSLGCFCYNWNLNLHLESIKIELLLIIWNLEFHFNFNFKAYVYCKIYVTNIWFFQWLLCLLDLRLMTRKL